MTHARELTTDEIKAVARQLDRPVVLVGLMGTGKSTVGQRLANLLETSFVDSDTAIEEAAQRNVAEIFADFGEPYFRDGERRVIARLLAESGGVIATGGGAFVQPDTRALILEHGLAVWLDCDIDTLVARNQPPGYTAVVEDGDPREILTRLRAERAPAYAEAPIHIETGDLPHHQSALRIVEAIAKWL